MNPNTAVNRIGVNRQAATSPTASDGLAMSEVETARDVSTGRHSAQQPEQPAVHRVVDSRPRISIDPMRSTDRYRLVQPANTAS